jgi:hypothetical protein
MRPALLGVHTGVEQLFQDGSSIAGEAATLMQPDED